MAVTEAPPQKAGDFRCTECTHHWVQEADKSPSCTCCASGHCQKCGQPNGGQSKLYGCVCCSMCETYPCDCDKITDKHGVQFKAKPPWENRGISLRPDDLKKYQKDQDDDHGDIGWMDAWPLLKDRQAWLDPCRVAADFYLLEAMQAGVLNVEHECEGRCDHFFGMIEDLDGVRMDASRLYKELVARLDPTFQQYVEMACGGELRHHPAMGSNVVSAHRRMAWAQWRVIREIVGNQAILDMADLFMDWKGGGFGGQKWAAAATLLHDRMTGRITAEQWCDRVFTLVHNGGVFLNKLEWACKNKKQWGLEQLQTNVLPAHGESRFNILLAVASPEVVKLWDENWVAMNKARTRVGVRPAVNPRRVKSRRRMCMHCNSNPLVGHHQNCHLFTSKMLPLNPIAEQGNIYVIDEDDFLHYTWTEWEKKDQPVSPDGHFAPKLGTQVVMSLNVSKGFHTYDRQFNVELGKLLGMQWKASNIGKEVRTAMAASPGKVEWRVTVWLKGAYEVLGYVSGSIAVEKFSKVILDMGLVVPQIAGVDWSVATEQYLNNLTIGEGVEA